MTMVDSIIADIEKERQHQQIEKELRAEVALLTERLIKVDMNLQINRRK